MQNLEEILIGVQGAPTRILPEKRANSGFKVYLLFFFFEKMSA